MRDNPDIGDGNRAGMQAGGIYIDESGHTGDLLRPDRGYGFSGQPHSVLAGVGPMSPEQASALLEPLVARHKLKMQEIKSDRLHKRPAFALDLIRALRAAEVPLFIEAVDKTFFLMTSIVNCQILPPVAGFAGGPEDQYVRNAFADFLYYRLPDPVLDVYVAACRADSAEAARASLVRLLGWAREADAEDEKEAAILAALGQSLADTLDDFEQACAEAPDGYRRFLPALPAGAGHGQARQDLLAAAELFVADPPLRADQPLPARQAGAPHPDPRRAGAIRRHPARGQAGRRGLR